MSARKYKIEECSYCKNEKPIAAKGLCRSCYQRLKRSGSLEYQRWGKQGVCKVDGCENHVVTHGLCDKHRKRMDRYGQIESLRPDDWGKREKHPLYVYWHDTKRRETLNLCEEWKDDFWAFVACLRERPSKNHYLRAVDLEERLGPSNWQWVKGITEANRNIANRRKRKRSERNRAKVSRDERQELLASAGNKCQICGASTSNQDCSVTGEKTTKRLAVDHCHETGKLRGILCIACNSGLGHFKDDISLLEKAIVYLSSNT